MLCALLQYNVVCIAMQLLGYSVFLPRHCSVIAVIKVLCVVARVLLLCYGFC